MKILSKDNIHMLSNHVRSYLGSLQNVKRIHNGRQWQYLEGGDEHASVIVLVHGMSGSKTQWRSLMQILSQHYRVIAVDFPGLYYGLTTDNQQYDFITLANHLKDFMDAVGIEQCHLLGHSMGANVCAAFAGHYPEYLNSLSLASLLAIDTVAGPGEIGRFAEFKQLLLINNINELEVLGRMFFFDPPRMPNKLLNYRLNEMKKHRRFQMQVITDMEKSINEVVKALLGIDCPCIVVNGRQDGFLTDRSLDIVERYLPHLTAINLDECAHMPFLEQPRLMAQHIKRFIHQVEMVSA